MLFNSIHFMIFFPIVIIIYYLIPKKTQYLWLLLTSYYFYMSWSVKYAFLLLFSTLITYLSGRIIDIADKTTNKFWQKKRLPLRKLSVALSFSFNLFLLIFFKYFDFLFVSFTKITQTFGIKLPELTFTLILPIGLSFYIFQSLSYIMDLYRGQVTVEKNFFRYALFVSFFPQILSGPIGRGKNMIPQLRKKHNFKYNDVKNGFLLMLWGFFLKLVIADRAAIFVNHIYTNYAAYAFIEISAATIIFAFQLYADFCGYSYTAIGAAQMLGYDLGINFNQPYFAVSIQDFWRRWHISLSSWFRDYLYIPLGGSRKGKLRKYLNLMITFLISGLWHGASWNYVIWGGLNGLFQIVSDITKPLTDTVKKILKINTHCESYHLFRVILTFISINFTWIFFRASSIKNALEIIKQMFHSFNPWVLTDGSLYSCGLSENNFKILIIAFFIMFIVDFLHEKNINIRFFLAKQNALFRYAFYYISILVILYYGVYGPAFSASQFIYSQF